MVLPVRLEILGEPAGMDHNWLLKGKPLGTHRHRCEYRASVIGEFLYDAGLGGFFGESSLNSTVIRRIPR